MENLEKITSTGNKLKDVLVGLPFGIAEINNPLGTYYVNSNYIGRGRANTGIGYLRNYEHNNMVDAAMMATANMQKGGNKNFALSKLGRLFNRNNMGAPYTLQGELKNPPYEGYGNYNLPYQNYQLPQTSFNYNGVVPQNYGLPTQSYGTLDFNRWK